MKRFAFAALVCLLFTSVTFAQQSAADAPASKEDIERYLDAMHSRELMESTSALVAKQMHQIVHEDVQKQQNLPPDFEARMDKSMDDMFKNLPVDELIDAMIPVYQKHLTKGDGDALIEFYSSPTAQKVLKEMPAIQAESMQSASGVIQKMMAKAQERVQSEIAQAPKEADSNSKSQPQSTPN
jgi:hypothetical protein